MGENETQILGRTSESVSQEAVAATNDVLPSQDLTQEAVEANAGSVQSEELTYERADGTIEKATSEADAISRCPVLGKLALEAPEQLAPIFRLQAAARKRALANNMDQQQDTKVSENTPEAEPIKPEAPIARRQFVPLTAEKARREAARHAAQQKESVQPVLKPASNTILAVGGRKSGRSRIKLKPLAIAPPQIGEVETNTKKDNTRRRKPRPEGAPPILPEVKRVQISKPERATVPSNKTHFKLVLNKMNQPLMKPKLESKVTTAPKPSEAVAVADVMPQEDGLPDEGENNTSYRAHEHRAKDAPVDVKFPVYTPDFETPKVTTKASQVYKRINEITAFQAANAQEGVNDEELIALLETKPSIDDSIELSERPIVLATAAMGAQEFSTLLSVRETANSEPLEKTLVRLARCLSSAEGGAEMTPILDSIKNIESVVELNKEILEAHGSYSSVPPELIEELVALLAVMGCNKPDEKLINFVEKFGISGLTLILGHLIACLNADNKPELNLMSPDPVSANSADAHLSLGRGILGLLLRVPAELHPATNL